MRTNITDPETGQYAGHFKKARADRIDAPSDWSEAHGDTISQATGSQWVDETLYRTAGGRWVLNHDRSRLHGGSDTYRFVTPEEAEQWMLNCGVEDETIARFFRVEEEVVYGRPEVGPQVNLRMPEDLRGRIDAAAEAANMTRAEWMRWACDFACELLAAINEHHPTTSRHGSRAPHDRGETQ